VALLAAGGCALSSGGTRPEIPEPVLAACATFAEDVLEDSISAVEQDRDQGFSRTESFAAFELGCRVAFTDAASIQACLTCGEAIYDSVYAGS
jgi:hypothetical protein